MPLSGKTLDFLMENRLQNSRVWFQEHKKEYQENVIAPMTQLVERLTPAMMEIDPELITEAKVSKTISRVYRDTRFSKDKSLYRDVMWCVFSRDRKQQPPPPAFVLEFSPDGFRYGCGYYSIAPTQMSAIRELMLSGDPDFLAARRMLEASTVFHLEGETYKRPHYPDQPEAMRQWLERKCLALMHNSKDFPLLFSEALPLKLEEGFRELIPFYRFLLKARAMCL